MAISRAQKRTRRQPVISDVDISFTDTPAEVTDLPEAARSEAVLEVPVTIPAYGRHTLKVYGAAEFLSPIAQVMNAFISGAVDESHDRVQELSGWLDQQSYRATSYRDSKSGRWWYSLTVVDADSEDEAGTAPVIDHDMLPADEVELPGLLF